MLRFRFLQFNKILTSNLLHPQNARSVSSTASLQDKKKTHYQVLGLTTRATPEEIREAFVRLSKEVHPDTNPNDPSSHVKFVRINEAYSVLSKSLSRREYDIALAYYMRARYMSQMHTSGESTAPGTGHQPNYDNEQQSEQEFWDETVWEMRDRSKDANAFYTDDSYYGIKGIRRQPNSVIGVIVVSIVVFGFVYFFFALSYISDKRREDIEKVTLQNARILREVQERARVNGPAKQIELLEERIAASEARRKAFMEALKRS